jgi:hypothetical protein
MNKDIFRFTGIRKKLIVYFLIITFLLGITSIFSYYNAKVVLLRLNTVVADYAYGFALLYVLTSKAFPLVSLWEVKHGWRVARWKRIGVTEIESELPEARPAPVAIQPATGGEG